MVSLRRCEKYTNWEATEAFEFNPEDFRSLEKSFQPYEGETNEEFADYIDELLTEVYVYDVCEELDELGLYSAAEMLSSLAEGEMKVYSSTTDKYSEEWIDMGVVDESYTKTGGFKINYSTHAP